MVASHHFTRIDTVELKEVIYNKIGHQRAESYFDQLKRFLSSKLSKVDFDKSCIQTIGRENLALHNRLIRSIIQNACQSKTPPQKEARKVEALGVKVPNGSQRSLLQNLYGDAFPHSPRKCRSPISRDRKFRDRPSPLGPLGKSPSITCEETVSRMQEQQSAAELETLSGRLPMGTAPVEEGEEVEQFAVIPSSQRLSSTAVIPSSQRWSSIAVIPSSQRWSSITAPLGVTLDLGDARKASHPGSSYHNVAETCHCSGELPDTRSLGRRLQKKLASEGVVVSLDGANLLNKAVDVFLKKLISPCIGVAVARESNGGIMSRSRSNGGLPGRSAEITIQPACASMLDFRVAMELNPSTLGADWPTQLEKIRDYDLQ